MLHPYNQNDQLSVLHLIDDAVVTNAKPPRIGSYQLSSALKTGILGQSVNRDRETELNAPFEFPQFSRCRRRNLDGVWHRLVEIQFSLQRCPRDGPLALNLGTHSAERLTIRLISDLFKYAQVFKRHNRRHRASAPR